MMRFLVPLLVFGLIDTGTYIHEFPHPKMTVHFHPSTRQFKLADLEKALDLRVHAVEVDLNYRESDGQVVCNHDRATDESPTLKSALDLIFHRKGSAETLNRDGLQFFVVLEPKEDSARLFDGIERVLRNYASLLSTAVRPGDKPRGVTIVITGSFTREFYSHFPAPVIDRFCIVERHRYGGEITNLSKKGVFQWVSIRHSKREGEDADRVRALHSGTDKLVPGRFNVRIWDCHRDLDVGLAAGADSLNCDLNEMEDLQRMLKR